MFLIISLTITIFLVLFFYVAISPKATKILLALTGSIAFIGGLFFYGWIFSGGDTILAIVQTCYITCMQFLGESPYEILNEFLSDTDLKTRIIMTTLCFCGVFTTAGTAIAAIGSKFLQRIQVWIRFKTPLSIIRPLNAETLEFARELILEKKGLVVFVDESPAPSCVEVAEQLGCLVRTDDSAVQGTPAFLKSIGMRKGHRQINLYALSSDQFANRQYARALASSMQALELNPNQSSLTIFANEDSTDNSVLCTEDGYSFGSMMCISQEQMAARLLMMKSPTWDAMTFDENCMATCNFHALVIGSGKVGQAVVKQIVMNGQFSGSNFKLSIFDPKYESVVGKLRYECGQIFDHYVITPNHYDARSCQMYEFLQENCKNLRYIVVCTGNDTTNLEVAQQLTHFLNTHNINLPIHICSRRGLQQITATNIKRWSVFSCEVLCTDEIDRKAKILNQIYCKAYNTLSLQENWDECNYFNRMSSRASADYAPAFLKMLGLPAGTVPTGNWYTSEQMNNMAISEHLRWCAFHYCMGIRLMTDEEFQARCKAYLEEKATGAEPKTKLNKDIPARIHRCLVSWDDLDRVSAEEKAVSGEDTLDYKQKDRDNVTMLPELMTTK